VRVARLTEPGTSADSQVVTSMHVLGVTTSIGASLPGRQRCQQRSHPCSDAFLRLT
jgi:hypothetical protein